MLSPPLEDELQNAWQALDSATDENIGERCKRYLLLLAAYRDELLKRSEPIHTHQSLQRVSSGKDSERRTIRSAIEATSQEQTRTDAILQFCNRSIKVPRE
jgi:hypothetical protein